MDPVADVIIAIRPPTIAIVTERQKAPNNPTRGSTLASSEKAIASGIMAKATTSPDRRSLLGLENHWLTTEGLDRWAITVAIGVATVDQRAGRLPSGSSSCFSALSCGSQRPKASVNSRWCHGR